jgi:hypothetical protein
MAETIRERATQSRRYRLLVTLEEDLHTGTGTGSAVVDALQARDRCGRPVVWWSHLKGLLRAAAEDLVDNDQATADQVQALFGGEGDSRAGDLRGHSLYLDPTAAQERPRTLVWSSTALQPGARLPLEDTLRSSEAVAATNQFKTELRLPSDSKLEALLKRCVKRMDALGLGRNRGQGRVLTALQPPKSTGNSAADWLKLAQRVSPQADSEATPGPWRLRLLLRNLDPVSLPTTGYPGNIIPTASFIRGQTLFGALANWARGDAETEGMLFSNDVQSVGDAFPVPAGCQVPEPTQAREWTDWEVLPIPLYVKTPKPEGDTGDWPWWFGTGSGRNDLGARREIDELAAFLNRDSGTQSGQDAAGSPEKTKRPKDHEYLFRTGADAAWVRYSPTLGVHLRNQTRDADLPDGALFAMDEIAEDTLFLATLRFANLPAARAFAERFAPVLAGQDWLAIGRGGRPLEVVDCHWDMAAPPPASTAAPPDPGPLTLTLTSDLIARDLGRSGQPPSLGFFDRLDPQVLADLTGVESLRGLDAKHWFEVSEAVEVRGYNAVVGLPRTAAVAIRRGSGIVVSDPQAAAALRQALATVPSLGERQDEGFGRFRLDLPLALGAPAPGPETDTGPASSPTPSRAPSNRREDLLGAVCELAARLGSRKLPSRSQWEALRGDSKAAANPQALILELKKHAETTGGASWKGVVEPIGLALQGLTPGEARDFLDALVRTLRPTLNRGRD